MNILKSLIVAMAVLSGNVLAAGIDNTCATCGRRALDSLNTIVTPIRVNQVGYRTDDPHKEAFVGGASSAQAFKIVDAAGASVYTGTLEDLGTHPFKGRIQIKGYFNSTTKLYQMANTTYLDSAAPAGATNERLWRAAFGDFVTEGLGYRIVVGSDTSLPFDVRMNVYNDVFETSLKFFGWQRSGDNDSWAHGPSHMKDGSAIGHDLTGGWYDCGDYFKVGQTVSYAFTNLILGYTLWPQKAEDRYGSSYNDTLPFGTDGVPDILREAKIGADYVMKLYRASLADGKIAAADMYQDVGVWGNDHQYWDKPENADAAPVAKGGPDRPVTTAKGSAVPAQFAGSLAMFAKAWEPFDPVFADSCLVAAKDIYKRVILPNWKTSGPGTVEGFYIAQGRWDDDLAWAATGLWYATGDTAYKYDLMGNPAYGNNPGAVANASQREFFPAGFMAMHASRLFSPGGWVMDYQNTFSHTTWALWKLFYRTDSLASTWKVPAADAQLVRERLRKLVGYRYANESTDGTLVPGTRIEAKRPYNLVWTNNTWGMNRYNMGSLIALVSYHEMVKEDSAATARTYWDIILDNMNYNLGKNPWDVSFLMGAGSKNLQHPHNRIANPEGYNAGGIPYPYRSPKGALMGGAVPGQLLSDEWEKYDVTETCIDFSAQMMLPAQYLSQDLPPDVAGPVFKNVTVVKTTETTALISWQTDELSRDTLFYSLFPGGPVAGSVAVNLAKNKSATLTGLAPNTTYSFWFKGMDIFRNVSTDDNRGRYYSFVTTTTSAADPKILDIKVCNIRADRATVFWWTDIPSSSSVEFAVDGSAFASTKKLVSGDDEGIPGRFHKVTLKGLKPGTTYRYDVLSDGVREDSNGIHRTFSTTPEFAKYSVQIKATKRNGSGAGAYYYLWVANEENKPYEDLEVRFYFQASDAVANSIQVHGDDNAMIDITGSPAPSPVTFNYGKAQAVSGKPGYWYIPITIKGTFPVAGRAKISMKMDDNNWAAIPWSVFADAWSTSAHADPVPFAGVDQTWLWSSDQPVEKNAQGEMTVTFVSNPYIAGYYKGVHIFGYPPDGTKPKVFRTTDFRFSAPVPSPATAVRQDSMALHYAGRTWSFPDVTAASWQVDNPGLRPVTSIAGRTDSVLFALDTTAAQGGGSDEFAFWGDRDSTYCSCAWQRYSVTIDTMKVVPRALQLSWNPVGPISAWSGNRRQELEVSLLDSAGLLDTTVTVLLSANAGSTAKFWSSATGGSPVAYITLVNGKATVWVSDETVESATLTATATVIDAIVKPASVTVAFQPAPLWPLVDSAWTRDSSCAGSPTHVVVKLSSRLSSENVVTGASLALAGKTVEVSMDSVRVAPDSMRVSIGLEAASASGSAVTGNVTLTVHAMGGGRDTTVSVQGSVLDRIGPRLLQARLLEEETPADPRDTLYLQFSEAVRLAGMPLVLPGAASAVQATGMKAADTTGRLWVVAVEPARKLSVGMTVKAAAAGVADLAGNAAEECAGDVILAQSWRPVPIASSWIRSSADDGRADQVVVAFRRKLRAQDVPDSVGAVWGTDSLKTTASTVNWSIASDSLSMTASIVFPWGATRGGGADGAGTLRFFAPGALVPSEASLADSIGPVLLQAMLRYGADDALDTVALRFSEPLIAASRAGVSWNADGQQLQGQLLAGKDASRWNLLLRADSTGLRAGDSLRALPRSLGGAQDEAGNSNEHAWRWAPLSFGSRPPVFLLQPRNPLVTFDNWTFGPGSALAALVRSTTDTTWMTVEGNGIASEENSRRMGIGIVTNECIDGYVVVYDNLGTYVASIDLKDLRKACEDGRIPLDLAGRYQAWIAWDGRSFAKQAAVSGVYTLRLITRRNLQSPGREKVTNQLFRFGWKRKQ